MDHDLVMIDHMNPGYKLFDLAQVHLMMALSHPFVVGSWALIFRGVFDTVVALAWSEIVAVQISHRKMYLAALVRILGALHLFAVSHSLPYLFNCEEREPRPAHKQ